MMAFVVILGMSWIAFAEDLGELAKKEKERREELARKGVKARVLTNQDIPNIKARLAIEPSSIEGETAEEAVSDETTAAEQEVEAAVAEETTEPSVDQQLQEVGNQKQELEQKAKDARDTVGRGGLFQTRNVGDQYRTMRESQEKIKALDKQEQELKEQKAEEESAEEEESTEQ